MCFGSLGEGLTATAGPISGLLDGFISGLDEGVIVPACAEGARDDAVAPVGACDLDGSALSIDGSGSPADDCILFGCSDELCVGANVMLGDSTGTSVSGLAAILFSGVGVTVWTEEVTGVFLVPVYAHDL